MAKRDKVEYFLANWSLNSNSATSRPVWPSAAVMPIFREDIFLMCGEKGGTVSIKKLLLMRAVYMICMGSHICSHSKGQRRDDLGMTRGGHGLLLVGVAGENCGADRRWRGSDHSQILETKLEFRGICVV